MVHSVKSGSWVNRCLSPTFGKKLARITSLKTFFLSLFLLSVTLPLNAQPEHLPSLQVTKALLAQQKQLQHSMGLEKSPQQELLEEIAYERYELLSELMQSSPGDVARSYIPQDYRKGMPAEVQALLLNKFQGEGELEIVVQETFDHPASHEILYFLKTALHERIELHFANKPAHAQTGDIIVAKGLLLNPLPGGDNAGDLAVNDGDYSITRAALDGAGTNGDPGPIANTFGEQTVLVVLVNFNDDTSTPWSTDTVRALLEGPVNSFILENSFGQTWLSVDVADWSTLPHNKADGCPYLDYERKADQLVLNQGFDANLYDRIFYVWPRNLNCSFSGLGTVGGAPSRADINGHFLWNTFTHELGHGFGLDHSRDLICDNTIIGDNCTFNEYGDYPDIMGGGYNGHFNAFQKDRLGWLGTGANAEILTVESSGAYSLAPYASQESTIKAIKVLKEVNSAGQNIWYYLEARQAIGADQGLTQNWSSNFVDGIAVHTGNKHQFYTSRLLDMTPETNTHIDAALEPGLTYSDPVAGVTITTTAVDGNGAELVVELTTPQTVCTPANPDISFTPAVSDWVTAGSEVSYTLTITNKDSSDCAASQFSLSTAALSGWGTRFEQSALTLSPGEQASTTVYVTSPQGIPADFYDIAVTAASGSVAATGTVTYVVAPPAVNHAPLAMDDQAETAEDNAIVIHILGNDTDEDGDALTITSVSGVNGTATINPDNSITFRAASGFSGDEVLNYSISDNRGGSDTANVTVTVTGNRAPVATADTLVLTSKSTANIPVMANDSDPDGDQLQVVSVTQGAKGSVSIKADGSISYAPAKSFKADDSFTYTISDGVLTATTTVSVTLDTSTSTTDGGGSTKGGGSKTTGGGGKGRK